MPSNFTETLVALQSKGLLHEKIRLCAISNNSLYAKLNCHDSRIRLEFKGSCLKQDKVSSTINNAVNLFNVYELDGWSQDLKT